MYCINNGNAKIINLLNKSDAESKGFAMKKCYVINDTNNGNYSGLNENDPSNV